MATVVAAARRDFIIVILNILLGCCTSVLGLCHCNAGPAGFFQNFLNYFQGIKEFIQWFASSVATTCPSPI
jgi:hypothetical protein